MYFLSRGQIYVLKSRSYIVKVVVPYQIILLVIIIFTILNGTSHTTLISINVRSDYILDILVHKFTHVGNFGYQK